MNVFLKYIFIALMPIIALASCGNDDEYVAGAQDSADKVGVYFPTTDGGSNDVDPADPTEFTIKVARMNTNGAVSVPLNVVANDDSIFQVPATAEFKDGEAETTVKVTFPDAAVGTTYTLTLEIPEEYVSLYKENGDKVSFTTSYSRAKWDDMGVGYFTDGTISPLFGGEFTMAVEIEKNVGLDGKTTRYRFDSPFAYLATAKDELGAYIGYPFNEEGDCDEQSHKIIITVKDKNATMAPVYTGMKWKNYGEFSIGQIVGNLKTSSGIITDTSTYPLGEYSEKDGSIVWPANSLYVRMSEYDGGSIFLQTKPTRLFLSTDAYKAYIDSQTGK